jgi:hypothetical protein
LIRPASISRPIEAIARVAMIVATVPSRVACSQLTDAAITLAPGGSVSEPPAGA